MEISKEAKEAARSCREYDLQGIIDYSSTLYAMDGVLLFESDIQTAIDTATAAKDERIRELEEALREIITCALQSEQYGEPDYYGEIEACNRHAKLLPSLLKPKRDPLNTTPVAFDEPNTKEGV